MILIIFVITFEPDAVAAALAHLLGLLPPLFGGDSLGVDTRCCMPPVVSCQVNGLEVRVYGPYPSFWCSRGVSVRRCEPLRAGCCGGRGC